MQSSQPACHTRSFKHKGTVYCKHTNQIRIVNCSVPNGARIAETMKLVYSLCSFINAVFRYQTVINFNSFLHSQHSFGASRSFNFISYLSKCVARTCWWGFPSNQTHRMWLATYWFFARAPNGNKSFLLSLWDSKQLTITFKADLFSTVSRLSGKITSASFDGSCCW